MVGPDLVFRSWSPAARGRYIETAERASRAIAVENDPRTVLETCAAWVETFYMSALTWEFIHVEGIQSLAQLREREADAATYVGAVFPDMAAVCQRALKLLGNHDAPAPAVHHWSDSEWLQRVRSFDAVVAECPIEVLESLGRRLDEPELAHRARTAYDALRAFVRRHDPARAEVMRIVGEQYRRGHLRLHDAARVLGMSTSDAVFELEQDGFCRAADAIRLTDAEREASYARLRERRLGRSRPPVVDPDAVDREVIASERIEGVDARAWLRYR